MPTFVKQQKTSSDQKEETRIKEKVEEPSPAPKEPYQPLKNVADVKVDDDYKTDAVGPFNFQDELYRIRQENERTII